MGALERSLSWSPSNYQEDIRLGAEEEAAAVVSLGVGRGSILCHCPSRTEVGIWA